MFRSIILFLIILGTATMAYADWTVPEQVNDGTEGLQATRDSDTPWGMATDDSGNVHFVFESQDNTFGNDRLYINYRVLDYINWIWEDEESVTADETNNHDAFGHPSIIFDEDFVGLVSYIMDEIVPWFSFCEMRTADFDFYGTPRFGPYDFMSNSGGKYAYGWADGAIKTPVMAMDNDGTIYGFWIYPDNDTNYQFPQVYLNDYVSGTWGTEEQHEIWVDYNDYRAYSICSLADPNGDIHLVMGLKLTPSDAS
ncbi:MAG: hypothetical protein JSW64_07080, partial [Candidatus Zixiibacteriota bacterium]